MKTFSKDLQRTAIPERQPPLRAPSTNSPEAAKKAAPAETGNDLLIMPAINTKQIKLNLQAFPKWSKRAKTIFRTFKFEGFLKGIDFVSRIAGKAQKTNHHPDIDIRFDQVTLTLTSYDEGGIMEKDFSVAPQ